MYDLGSHVTSPLVATIPTSWNMHTYFIQFGGKKSKARVGTTFEEQNFRNILIATFFKLYFVTFLRTKFLGNLGPELNFPCFAIHDILVEHI
jgi:hypothetical protein